MPPVFVFGDKRGLFSNAGYPLRLAKEGVN